MRIRKLHMMLLRSYAGPLILTFFIALFVLLMQFVWKYIDDLVGKGLDAWIIAKLLFYASSTFVPMALPLAILLSSLMTFGNLGENYELVAAKSAGISLRKIMMPLIWVSLAIAGIGFYFSNTVLPVANLKMATLLHDVREQKPAFNIREGVFYRDIDNFVIRVGKKERDGKTISRVLIYDHSRPGGSNNLTIAGSGIMEMTEDKRNLIFTLRQGVNYYESLEQRQQMNSRPMQRMIFKEEIRRFDLSSFSMNQSGEDLFREHHQMMNLVQLSSALDTLTMEIQTKKQDFANQILGQFFFLNNLVSRNDTLPKTKILQVSSFDSIAQTFDKADQSFIYAEALASSRKVKVMADHYLEEMDARQKNVVRYKAEMHRKFTLAIACLLLFFIGAPLGAIIRKGGLGLPLVVSVLVFVFYYILSITGEKFAKETGSMVWFGMWLSSAVLLPFGVWLTIKTTSDSPLMDSEIWKRPVEKINSLIKARRAKKHAHSTTDE